jgi:phage baseplate assembly protein W
LIRTAILRFEPRIELLDVNLDDSGELEGRVLITVEFRIRATNTRSNLVFPYYKNEASN